MAARQPQEPDKGSDSDKEPNSSESKSKGIPLKKVAVVVGAGVVGTAATAALAPVVLGAAGFTAGGVAAGSLAASWMSAIGSVSAGSTFALLQSAGAAGVGATVPIVGGLFSSAVAGVAQALRRNKNEDKETKYVAYSKSSDEVTFSDQEPPEVNEDREEKLSVEVEQDDGDADNGDDNNGDDGVDGNEEIGRNDPTEHEEIERKNKSC